MSIVSTIAAGRDIPEDFNVIIEIAADSAPVKYELDKDTGMLVVDRFMPGAMRYPCNYGFVPSTLSQDGDPVDVLVVAPYPVQPGTLVRCRAIGLLQMTDESGKDSKILAVPINKICAEYAYIQTYTDIPPVQLQRICNFFERYKDLEANKWVQVDGWDDKKAAHKEILESVARANDNGEKKTVNLAEKRNESKAKPKAKPKTTKPKTTKSKSTR